MARHQVGRAGGGMADNDRISADRTKRVRSVEQRFALFDAGSRGLHERGDGAERLGGDFKGCSGAGGGFVKEQNNTFVAQQRPPRFTGIHAAGQLQKIDDLPIFEMLNVEKRPFGRHSH